VLQPLQLVRSHTSHDRRLGQLPSLIHGRFNERLDLMKREHPSHSVPEMAELANQLINKGIPLLHLLGVDLDSEMGDDLA
jgi:hypothetical protein